MNTSPRLTGGVLAGLFLALHLPFLPPSLEDLDSVNFALGIRDFDPSQHQPHPPGYPVFMAVAKLLHAVGLSEVHALSLISVVSGAAAVIALFALFEELDRDRPRGPLTWMAAIAVVTCPLFWITAARPLSDLAGLTAALFVQAALLRVNGVRPLALAALAAGFAAGIRSQVVWLTLPLLLLAVFRLPSTVRMRGTVEAAVGYAVGVVLWFVPLIIASGGPQRYWHALFDQGAEDLTGVVLVATMPTLRNLVSALYHAFVAPWGAWPAAAAVLVSAMWGLVVTLRQARPALTTLAFAFGPYLAFDVLFQEAITTRYALPLVIPVVYLGVRGVRTLSATPALFATIALVVWCAVIDDRVAHGFSQMEAPAFRMLGDMSAAAHAQGERFRAPALAMHRREEFDMRRPIRWVGTAMPDVAMRLPSPPKHEWLELVKYWNGGGRAPVWFIADPLRSDLALIGRQVRPSLYRWPFEPDVLIGGARPSEMDWHVIDAPEWYLGEGWALTPETAGVAREDGRGPGRAPIQGWVRRRSRPTAFMIGGRNLSMSGVSAELRVRLDGQEIHASDPAPGFFLHMFTVPSVDGPGDYAEVQVSSDSVEMAIEQFAAQPADQLMFGFGEGWHEHEYDPETGELWRWTSDRATLRVRAGGHGAALTLRGELEAASSSQVTIRIGAQVAAQFEVGRQFSRTVLIPRAMLAEAETAVVIETSAWAVPAETSWRSRDRRRLGLKVFECQVTPVS